MKESSFNNLSELNTYLKNLDISVPQRSRGRKTEHTEQYSIVSFLLQFKNELQNDFPLKLIHADKPDFRIITQSSSIGIEITESIPEQLARASYLLEKHYPEGGKLEPEFFGWDSPERTKEEILEILEKSNESLIGKGFSGNSIEEEWIQGILGCINNKTQKLNKDDFEKYKQNWLLIYDNQTKAFFDKEYFLNKFPLLISNYFNNNVNFIFARIIIESGNNFYSIDSKGDALIKVVRKNGGLTCL